MRGPRPREVASPEGGAGGRRQGNVTNLRTPRSTAVPRPPHRPPRSPGHGPASRRPPATRPFGTGWRWRWRRRAASPFLAVSISSSVQRELSFISMEAARRTRTLAVAAQGVSSATGCAGTAERLSHPGQPHAARWGAGGAIAPFYRRQSEAGWGLGREVWAWAGELEQSPAFPIPQSGPPIGPGARGHSALLQGVLLP